MMNSDSGKITVSVLIPIYNNARTLRPLLDSLMNQTVRPEEMIVIDDGSTDNGCLIASSYFGVRVILIDKNMGPSVARNTGALSSTQEILMFLDSDVVLPAHAVRVVKKSFAERPEMMAINGCMEKKPVNPNFFTEYKALIEYGWSQEMPNWSDSSRCINARIGAIRRNVFLKTGGFNTGYRKPSVEDHEFGLRITRKHRIYFNRDLTAFHDFSGFCETCRNYFCRTDELLQLLWLAREEKFLEAYGASARSMTEFSLGFLFLLSLLFAPFGMRFLPGLTFLLFALCSAKSLRFHFIQKGPVFFSLSLMVHSLYGAVVVAAGIKALISFKLLRIRSIPMIQSNELSLTAQV